MTSKIITPLTVGFPLYDGVTLTDFVGPTDVFAYTQGYFTPVWVAAERRPIKTSSGTFIYPNYTFREKSPLIDILFVPGGHADGLISNAMFNKEFQTFIKQTAANAKWVGSVCVGAFILAAAGVLKGCTVTTYWSQVDNLRLLSKYCSIKVSKGYPRGIIDEKKKRFTGGGISSSIDMALMLAEKIKGKKFTEETQLFIQYAPNPPVHAGDPSTAPASVFKKVTAAEVGSTHLFYNAVQQLLNGGN
jgi:cyclohexyl-isocyanide hydratase